MKSFFKYEEKLHNLLFEHKHFLKYVRTKLKKSISFQFLEILKVIYYFRRFYIRIIKANLIDLIATSC
jgi:hypothetical protein